MKKLLLAVDVGGTKVNLGLFEFDVSWDGGVVPEPVAVARFASQEIRGLEDPTAEFLRRLQAKPSVACIGFAGPVVHGKAKASNIPWDIDAETFRRAIGVGAVALLNDLEAAAHGVLHVHPGKLETLQAGEPDPSAMAAVIAAGTGLGEAMLANIDGRRRAIASEAGHADFAAIGEDQIGLLRYLSARFGRVSYERVLGGPGIARIFDYLSTASKPGPPEQVVQQVHAAKDPSAQISMLAVSGADATAVRTLEIYADIYGAEAGNLAVRSLAYAGVYIAGGIAPKILSFLRRDQFLHAYRAKGRAASVAARCPVHVVMEERLPLLGAAAFAARM